MTNILNASVYVGTYAKYNAGSLAGKWMNLNDYTTKRAFYDACKKLHQDEHDQEFMFQDWENVPASLISESSISDEVWHVLNSLKKFAPGRSEEFAAWCEDNGAEQDYQALKEFLGFNQPKDRKTTKPMAATTEADQNRPNIYIFHTDSPVFAGKSFESISVYIDNIDGVGINFDITKYKFGYCWGSTTVSKFIIRHMERELKNNTYIESIKEVTKEEENIAKDFILKLYKLECNQYNLVTNMKDICSKAGVTTKAA